MDVYKAIRLRALRSVLFPDKDYIIRRTLRWYSKTFFTPLREVEDLPLEDVFQAYYEERYATLSDEDLDHEREDLLVTDEERYDRAVAEEAEEAEMFELSKIIAAEEAAKRRAAKKTSTPEQLAEIQHAQPEPMKLAEPLLPALPKVLPPDITMTFMTDDAFEAEVDGFGSMSQPVKP